MMMPKSNLGQLILNLKCIEDVLKDGFKSFENGLPSSDFVKMLMMKARLGSYANNFCTHKFF